MKDYLPNIEDINVLPDASEANTIAHDAVLNLDKLAAAHIINSAPDTGENRALWQRPMSDELKQYLEAAGYVVDPVVSHIARPGSMTLISWK